MLKNAYIDRDKSCIIRELMHETGVGVDEMAKAVGCTTQSFRNKLSRNSWSFDEVATMCKRCKCDLTIKRDGHFVLSFEKVSEKEIII